MWSVSMMNVPSDALIEAQTAGLHTFSSFISSPFP